MLTLSQILFGKTSCSVKRNYNKSRHIMPGNSCSLWYLTVLLFFFPIQLIETTRYIQLKVLFNQFVVAATHDVLQLMCLIQYTFTLYFLCFANLCPYAAQYRPFVLFLPMVLIVKDFSVTVEFVHGFKGFV